MHNRQKFVVALVVLITSLFLSLSVGSSGFNLNPTLVKELRLPRTLLGLSVGGGLSLSGVLLQGLFRNPLVEPYTLGISGGAALFVSLGIVMHLPQTMGWGVVPFLGFAGALATILTVYILSTKKGSLRVHNMLLIGVMISFISSSLIMLVMAVSKVEDLHGIIFWIMGSLEGVSKWTIAVCITILLIGTTLAYLFVWDLNALMLGEEEAIHLGVNVEVLKKALFFTASLITGVCVSSSGIIGFVGLVVPHFVRIIFGHDHRVVIPASVVSGASFLVLCDTLARVVVPPMELPVGVITGVVGGILFIYALIRRQV